MTVKYPTWINKIEGAAQTPEEMNGIVEVIQNHAETLSLHDIRILAAASGIYTDALTPTSEVPAEVGDKVFLATIPGTYTNFGNVILPVDHFGFIFKNGNSFSIQSVEMPMQDLSPLENRIKENENKVDNFIENFAVEVDKEFNQDSENAISNKEVTKLANVLVDFYDQITNSIYIDTSVFNYGYIMNDGAVFNPDNNCKYIILTDNVSSYKKIYFKGYKNFGTLSTYATISHIRVKKADNTYQVISGANNANLTQNIIEQTYDLPENITEIAIGWANYEASLNSVPIVILTENNFTESEINIKEYIDNAIENTKVGEEIEGNNLLEFTDKNDNKFLEVDNDGNLKVKGIVADNFKRSTNKTSTTLGGIIEDKPSLNLPKPNFISKVVIEGFPYVQTTDQFEVECMLTYTDRFGNGFKKKAIVAVQGSTSQGLPKKNLAIDLLNEDDSDFKIQFGDWVPLSSFHLKAEYWCVWHYRSLFASQFFEQMDMSRAWHLQKPWRAPYSANNGTLNQRFKTGARGHIDGFPIEVYIGETFIGIYNWNQKKHRDNYEMKKDNLNHIIVDSASTFNAYFKNEIETAWEIRNPSGLKAVDGSKYEEGKELSETDANSLQVKNAIKRFFGWGKNVSVANLKAEAPNYLHIERTIDWFLHCHFLYAPDNYIRNTIWCTWDALKWAPMAWDLEAVLGMGILGYANEIPPTKIGFVGGGYNHIDGDGSFNPKFYQAFKTEIEQRYAELRRLGIFTTENVIKYFEERERQVPYEIFKKDMDIYLSTPSNRSPQYSSSNDVYPNGGFYDSIPRLKWWLDTRITALDTYFNFNNN